MKYKKLGYDHFNIKDEKDRANLEEEMRILIYTIVDCNNSTNEFMDITITEEEHKAWMTVLDSFQSLVDVLDKRDHSVWRH